MSRSELHNWECAIERLSGDNADKMLAIAQDIYNTAFVRGKNYMSLDQESALNKIKEEIKENTYFINEITEEEGIDFKTVEEIIDKYARRKDIAIQALEQQPCEDCISRKSIKQKLQEQHDFFVNAYGGFSNLPLNDKSRVDEITNCIAIVVNEPPATSQPKIGHWINIDATHSKCDRCEAVFEIASENGEANYCPNCGAKMEVNADDSN